MLNFNYSQAISQASRIESIAGKIKSDGASAFRNHMDDVSACWEGHAAGLYLENCGMVRDKIIKYADALLEVAASMRTVAETIREAELRAEEEARRRDERLKSEMLKNQAPGKKPPK